MTASKIDRLLVKNWASFQHYKNRAPAWIKLHKAIIDDYEFARLQLASKALAPCIWLLASESSDGSIPNDPEWLAFRLHWEVDDVIAGLKPLIDGGFLIIASMALAERLQGACLEKEIEKEKEEACVPSGEGTPPANPKAPKASRPRNAAVPYQAIVDGYNAAMPRLAKVREVTAKRKAAIERAWRESPVRQSEEFWLAYWEECADDPFRNGKGPYKPPHENWRPDFDFLIRSDQVTKVYEAAMQRMEARA